MTESQNAGLPWAPGSYLSLQRHHRIVNRSTVFTAKSRGWWLTFLQPRNVTFVIFKLLSRSYFYLFQLSFWHLRGKQSLLHKKCIETTHYEHGFMFGDSSHVMEKSPVPSVGSPVSLSLPSLWSACVIWKHWPWEMNSAVRCFSQHFSALRQSPSRTWELLDISE